LIEIFISQIAKYRDSQVQILSRTCYQFLNKAEATNFAQSVMPNNVDKLPLEMIC